MTWHAGDNTPPLADTAGVDLTGATSVAHVKRPDGTLITRAATVATGTTGAWSLPWLAGELDTGVFVYELEATWPDGRVQTFGPGSFRVEPQLDTSPPYVPPAGPIISDGGAP